MNFIFVRAERNPGAFGAGSIDFWKPRAEIRSSDSIAIKIYRYCVYKYARIYKVSREMWSRDGQVVEIIFIIYYIKNV